VCDQETSKKNEEAETRYRAVKNTTTMGCNARKKNKHYNLSKAQMASSLMMVV